MLFQYNLQHGYDGFINDTVYFPPSQQLTFYPYYPNIDPSEKEYQNSDLAGYSGSLVILSGIESNPLTLTTLGVEWGGSPNGQSINYFVYVPFMYIWKWFDINNM